MKEKAIALLSSGLDSAIATAMAVEKGLDIILALTIDYGQRAAASEIANAAKIAEYLEIRHKVISLPWFGEFSKKGLLSAEGTLPTPIKKDLDNKQKAFESAKAVWVPNRNGVFIEIAAHFAESLGACKIIVGFNAEEAATFSDNTPDYVNAVNQALKYSTATQVEVVSPTLYWKKNEIVHQAKLMQFPIEHLWSCYESRSQMCGKCESCMRLKRSLISNVIPTEGLFEHASL